MVGQSQTGIVWLLSPLVDMKMGLAAVVVPGSHTVLTENIKPWSILLFHNLGEDMIDPIEGSRDDGCFFSQAGWEGMVGRHSVTG